MDIKTFHKRYGHCLGETSVEDFLNIYWQKKPLLIRNAFNNIEPPLSAEELAGLACEDHVNARLVLAEDGDKAWQVEFGPFDESRFNTLPASNWSLLVSDIEKHLPETKSLLKPFHFIPDWRIDDLMISYAPGGGSVGAHTDAYDVFLLQLSGQRLWQISETFDNELIPDTDLRILKRFEAEQEWLLNPGDMLYLPPNVAHYGVAKSDGDGNNTHCMTASIGFRSPSLATASNEFIHYLSSKDQHYKNLRFTDRIKTLQDHHAEITDDTVAEFIDFIKQGLQIKPEQVKHWLGLYCSDNKTFDDYIERRSEEQTFSYDEIISLASQSTLLQSPYSQFLFSKTKTGAILFVNGEEYNVSQKFAEFICDTAEINVKQLQIIIKNDDKHIFSLLFNQGAIIVEDEYSENE